MIFLLSITSRPTSFFVFFTFLTLKLLLLLNLVFPKIIYSSESYSIQAGAFSTKENAQDLLNSLEKNGIACALQESAGPYKVYCGEFSLKSDADATKKKFVAEQEKKKTIIDAEAEKQRIAKVYGKILELGDLGKLIRTLEALEKSPGQGAKWIIPVPSMADLFSQVFPGRNPDTLKTEEIRILREMLEKAKQDSLEVKVP